jgi:creatinine amidohydrolase/Fe(II)-dependent formamide hydrolase-like protein
MNFSKTFTAALFFLSALFSCKENKQVNNTLQTTSNNRIYHLQELTTTQLQALDKAKTVVLLPGGILEQHGPYLPVFSDGYWNERLTDTIGKTVSATGDWNVLIFPTIPIGNSGANDIGERYSFPGTYTVRFETLRSIFMDLAIELGEQGFRNIFIIHSHGAPNHQRALDQAADFFNETYKGKMVNLMGISALQLSWFDAANAKEQEKEDGMKMHGGMSETSSMLYLVPHLVDSSYKQAAAFAGTDMEALVQTAKRKDWQGYFGSPRIASAAYGKKAWETNAKDCLHTVLGILQNKITLDTLQTFSDFMKSSEADEALDKLSLEEEQRRKAMQIKWLSKRRLQ